MAKYYVFEPEYEDELVSLIEADQEVWDDPDFDNRVEIPWWLVAKHELVQRDIKNLNAELLALRDRKEVAS